MNYIKIPEDIQNLIDKKKSNRKVIYEDNNYIVVHDIKHTNKSYHYTAWYKHNYKSLLDIKKKDLIDIENVIKNIKLLSEPHIYIHFPPSIWSLHIHFVERNHIFTVSQNVIHKIKDIINNILLNQKYYLDNVIIR